MKLFVILSFCVAVFGDSSGPTPSPTPLPTIPTKSATTPTPTNTTMMPSPSSKQANNTSSTAIKLHSMSTLSMTKNTTATSKPTTAPKSTISPNVTVTPFSTPSPTPKPTTTPIPTTLPPYGNFDLEEGDVFCLLAEFAATFTIQFSSGKNGTKIEKVVEYLNEITNVSVTGNCGINASNSNLVLSWPKKKPFYVLTMEFKKTVAALAKSNKTMNWEMSMMTFNATVEDNEAFNNFSGNATFVVSTYNNTETFPKSEVGFYYKCEAAVDVDLKNGLGDKFEVKSVFSDMKIEPFANSKDGRFGNDSVECQKDKSTARPPTTEPSKSNDIVPIAVGCALAGLVLIVLIAYVIGRRKSHSGYEKV